MMEIQFFYDTARDYIDKIKEERPAFASEADLALCLIMTDTRKVFSGVTGIGINDEEIISVPAECAALTSMLAAGQVKAAQMLKVMFADYSISEPCAECLDLLLRLDTENAGCEVAVALDKIVAVQDLKDSTESAPIDFFSGFDDDAQPEAPDPSAFLANGNGFDESYSAPQYAPEEVEETAPNEAEEENEQLGAPADFVTGFEVDESNPFYEPSNAESADASTEGVKVINKKDDPGKPDKKKAESAEVKNSEDVSNADLLKQAKQRKKVAKANFKFFKKKM